VTPTKNAHTYPRRDYIYVPSAATDHTSPSPGNVTPSLPPPSNNPKRLPQRARSPLHRIIPHFDFLKNLNPRQSPPGRLPKHEKIFSHIQTPYNPDAFDILLQKHDLTSSYPFLTRNLCNGFPMGEFPVLTKSVIFPNHPSCTNYDNEIRTYLEEEVVAGRMFGPFSQAEMQDIMKGPFQSSPLIIDVQPQPDGAPDKIRMCRHMSKRDKFHPSTNDYVDAFKFPTRFGSVSEVGEIVSPSFSILKNPHYAPHNFITSHLPFMLPIPYSHSHLDAHRTA
jgi:hypothetical protein